MLPSVVRVVSTCAMATPPPPPPSFVSASTSIAQKSKDYTIIITGKQPYYHCRDISSSVT